MPYAKVGDIKLYYEVHGDGPPVVLVPGLGSDTRLFFNVVPLLATLHQVILLDPRGAGQSDKPTSGYSIEQMAEDVAGLFGTLGTASADVVGYSMGGKIDPGRVKSARCSSRAPNVLYVSAEKPANTRPRTAPYANALVTAPSGPLETDPGRTL